MNPLALAVAVLLRAGEPSAPEEAPPAMATVVTATRLPRPSRDVPATVTVVPREELDRSPTLTLDTLVRTLPSVQTFRRSSSLVADPSSQGLNLRGVGPSGVSRGLVWLDGAPVNDPFGGWVYWQSVPRLGLERIEVSPGGASALYGSSALGGVMQLFSRRMESRSLEADLLGGSFDTALGALRLTERRGALAGALEGELWTTAGYPVVTAEDRGAVDGRAFSRHGTANATVEYEVSPSLRLRWTGGYFQEAQNGGTEFTTAEVRQGSTAASASWSFTGGGALGLTAFGKLQRFDQDRARISAARDSETLGGSQRVPANELGVSAIYGAPSLPAFGTHELSAGVDLRRVSGRSEETLVPFAPGPTSLVGRVAGGDQLFAGAFAQDAYSPRDDVELQAALRVDGWRNQAGFRELERGSGETEASAFAQRTELQWSPRLGVLYRPIEPIAVRASAYRSFRAPTLNELYRPFQVGTVLTAANEGLRAETLLGAELGVEAWVGSIGKLRATGFWNELQNPITNVTLEAPLPDGSRRQRQNLGQARSPGVELEADARLAAGLSLLVAYTFVDAHVTEAADPELVGKQLAQDPQHRGHAAVSFTAPGGLTATVQLRVNGPQFEDDQNLLPMAGYALLDASVSVPIYRGLELFASGENLTNRTYLVGRAGVDTIGQPIFFRGGLRLRERP